MFVFEPQTPYMMPAHFGPRPAGKATGWYRDVTTLAVSYVTDADKLAAHLPEPFEVGEEPLVNVFCAMNKEVDWLAGHGYNLLGVTASVVFRGEETLEGTYTLVMWENLADPILTGRELQGIPKVYAEIPDPVFGGDNGDDGIWRASARHFGHPIAELRIGGLVPVPREQIDAFQAAREGKDHWFGCKVVPAVHGFGTELVQITTYPTENVIREAWMGAGEVAWERLTWEQNPTQHHIVNALADLPMLEMRPALVSRGSANLVVPERPPRVLK